MKNERIVSALIGLVGAVGNNGKTDNTDIIIKEALLSEDSDEIVGKIHKEKYVISPSCKTCTSPCGNTSDFDMNKFHESSQEIKELKLQVLEAIVVYAGMHDSIHPETYKAITYMGYDLSADTYKCLLQALK